MASNKITLNPNAKDYDKYDFSGYELTENDKGGYDWADSSGNKHSLYDDGKGGFNHSITGKDGTSSNYTYIGTRDNEYINKLNKSAKKAYKAQAKAPKTGVTQKATQNLKTNPVSGSQVIIMMDENGNPRKVGTTLDKNADGLLTGKSVANSYKAIANANIGDFWVDNENNIHVVTDRDIKYSKGVLEGKYGNDKDKGYSEEGSDEEAPSTATEQPRTTTPEENPEKDSDERIVDEVEGTRKLLHDPDNYKDNYQAIIDTAGKREIAEGMLSDSEGKGKGIYGILPAFLMGDYGNYHLPKHETHKRYKLRDSITGELIDDGQGATPAQLKRLNEQIAKDRKERGWTITTARDGGYDVISPKTGEVIEHFDNEKDAKKYLNGWFELSDEVANEQHVVSYNGKKMAYDTKGEAEKAKKELSKMTRPERAKAWAQFLYHTLNSISANDRNLSSDLAGQGRPYKSSWETEIENRQKGNNEMYYKNEEAKNDFIRKLVGMADSGMIDLNNLTNEQMARFIGLVGEKKATQIIDTIRKQELDKFMALDYWKNWDEDQRNALSAWFAQSGQGPQTDSMIALASGKASPKDFANKWKTETRLAIAEKATTLQHLEREVDRIALENKLTKAQADVIKELVGEQLRAAKLTNDRQIQAMVTDSASSLAKIIDAVVPF